MNALLVSFPVVGSSEALGAGTFREAAFVGFEVLLLVFLELLVGGAGPGAFRTAEGLVATQGVAVVGIAARAAGGPGAVGVAVVGGWAKDHGGVKREAGCGVVKRRKLFGSFVGND